MLNRHIFCELTELWHIIMHLIIRLIEQRFSNWGGGVAVPPSEKPCPFKGQGREGSNVIPQDQTTAKEEGVQITSS